MYSIERTSTSTSPSLRTDVFFDRDILLYLPNADVHKADLTEKLLIGGGVTNPLVLAEVAAVMVRKSKRPWTEVHLMLATIRANTLVLPLGDDALARGIGYAERYRLQVFDAIILASAVLAGCHTLWSEDMSNGQTVDGVTIRNPFEA